MADKLTIANWSPEDQPRERLRDLGPQQLSDAELLAILGLRTDETHPECLP